jgi:transcription elongation factor GreA-like protein
MLINLNFILNFLKKTVRVLAEVCTNKLKTVKDSIKGIVIDRLHATTKNKCDNFHLYYYIDLFSH